MGLMGWASFSLTCPDGKADGGVRGSIDKSAEGDGCLCKEHAQAARKYDLRRQIKGFL
jgi:hypothetical protein